MASAPEGRRRLARGKRSATPGWLPLGPQPLMPQLAELPRGYAALRARLGELPAGPGVYLFRDRSGWLLYIGKSVCLRQRVSSYFGEHAGRFRKLRRLRSRVAAV